MPRICKHFEITSAIYSSNERSLQFLKQNTFLTFSQRFHRSNTLEQLEFKLEKIIGIQKLAGKVRKCYLLPYCYHQSKYCCLFCVSVSFCLLPTFGYTLPIYILKDLNLSVLFFFANFYQPCVAQKGQFKSSPKMHACIFLFSVQSQTEFRISCLQSFYNACFELTSLFHNNKLHITKNQVQNQELELFQIV